MNIVYITGAARCGKTTLAEKLIDNNISILSLDAFSKSVRSVFSDFILYSGAVCIQPDTNREKFLELVCKYTINFFNDFPYHTLLIEGCHFTPNEFLSKFPDSRIICLGRTASKEDIVKAIITKDWMADLPRKIINEYAEKIYNYSLGLKENEKEYLYFETEKVDIAKVKKYIKGDYCDV